jgi:hypothetical protein
MGASTTLGYGNWGLLLLICSLALAVAVTGFNVCDENRRNFLSGMLALTTTATTVTVNPSQAKEVNDNLRDYYNPSLPNWKGTSLPGPMSLSGTYARLVQMGDSESVVLQMGRWPDPILRQPSTTIPLLYFRIKINSNSYALLLVRLRIQQGRTVLWVSLHSSVEWVLV